MTKDQIRAAIIDIGIVPIVRTNSTQSAIQSVQAVYNGGIRAAEVTMTVPGALKALEQLADAFGDKMMLGAGTVRDPETAPARTPGAPPLFVTPGLPRSVIAEAPPLPHQLCAR